MTTTINRLLISGAQAATPAYRLALESTLGQVEFQPSTMPPAAILIVRRLADPLPKRLRPVFAARPDQQWQKAAGQAMDRLYRQAVRPVDGPTPASAEAVLFADQAELLACLALDVSLGRAAQRWWWRSYRRRWGGLARDALPALLLEWPQALPAALRLLHQRGQAAPLLQALAPAETRQLLAAICTAFQAPLPSLPARDVGPTAALSLAGPSGEPLPAGRDAPWRAWLAAGDADAAPEGECLLGVALTLAHAPSVAQTEGFRSAVEAWWRRGQAPRDRPALPAAHDASPETGHPRAATSVMAVSLADQPRPATDSRDAPSTLDSSVAPAPAAPSSPPIASHASPRRIDPLAEPEPPRGPAAAGAEAAAALTVIGARQQEPMVGDRPALASDATPGASQARVPDFADGVPTGLGGVLFLINVMQQLDLPACFEPGWRLASQVGPWGVLELLARGLLAERGDLASDPLWAALALLDDRVPGEPVGAAVTGPAAVSIPAAWAFWLDADPVAGQPVERVDGTPLNGPLLRGVSRAMRRWLAAVTPLLRRMVYRALGGEVDLAAGLLLRHGQLYVTSSHVDLVMPLNSVSLPVRLAGLDFNPGWLPAFGRIVQFHYQ